MIERLTRSLDWLAEASATELRDARALADGADAVRLVLDCMQQELSRDQRDALLRLWELLEEGDVAPAELTDAARRARAMLVR